MNLAESPRSGEKPWDGQLVFVHIPKTAGYSLHTALERIYGRDCTLRIGNDVDLKAMCKLPSGQVIDKKFLSGHFSYDDVKNRCRPDAMLISILRDPVARILSNYNFIASRTQHPLHKKVIQGSFADHVHQYRNVLRGLCCRQLSGFPQADAAIETVRSRYALVGSTEQFSAFITALRRLTGEDIPMERKNVSRGQGPKIDLNSALCEVLLEITQEDRKLVAFLKSLPGGLFESPTPQE